MSRTPSVDAAVVAARLQAGETRAEIAQRLGTSYANVVVAAQRWQRLSGFSLPRARSLRRRACLPAEPHRRALDQGSHGGAELALDRLC